MPKQPDTFAARLAAALAAAGFTNYRLAQLTGLSESQVGRYVRGERQPSWAAVCRIADALKVSTETLR